MAQYQSSIAFGQLKQIHENIQGNYSSAQYVEVLDFLLYQSLEPLLEHTRLFQGWLPQVLAWYNTNSNRKISAVSKEELQTLVCMFLLAPPDKRLAVLKRMRLERNLLADVADKFLTTAHTYRQVVEQRYLNRDSRPVLEREQRRIEALVGLENGDMYSLYQTVSVWFSYYTEFRGYIGEKFIRLALMKAKETYELVECELPLDDCIQHYLMAVGKAIDKFDVALGSLASYVGQWFLNARTQVRKEISVKCESLDQMQDQGFTLGDEDNDVYNQVERKETIERIRLIAKLADPVGLARIHLGIEEIISA